MNTTTVYWRSTSPSYTYIDSATSYSTRNPSAVSEESYRSNRYFYSVILRLKRNWNRLPCIVRSFDTVGLFKTALENHLYNYS